MTVPTLILIGESDDWTPAEACRKLVEGQDDLGMTRQKGAYGAEKPAMPDFTICA